MMVDGRKHVPHFFTHGASPSRHTLWARGNTPYSFPLQNSENLILTLSFPLLKGQVYPYMEGRRK